MTTSEIWMCVAVFAQFTVTLLLLFVEDRKR